MFSNENFCKLILVKNDELIGFISIFSKDCDEEIALLGIEVLRLYI